MISHCHGMHVCTVSPFVFTFLICGDFGRPTSRAMPVSRASPMLGVARRNSALCRKQAMLSKHITAKLDQLESRVGFRTQLGSHSLTLLSNTNT
jgi:hypothetical protein